MPSGIDKRLEIGLVYEGLVYASYLQLEKTQVSDSKESPNVKGGPIMRNSELAAAVSFSFFNLRFASGRSST